MTFPDFEEFIECLNAHSVRYLIVGGYAVGFHARPRATKDLDVLVDRSAANARRVLDALTDFLGSRPENMTLAKLQNPRTVHDWKSCVRATVPRVRIPPSPQS